MTQHSPVGNKISVGTVMLTKESAQWRRAVIQGSKAEKAVRTVWKGLITITISPATAMQVEMF